MASTYTTDLAIQLMATGENAGTWGQITNTNLVVSSTSDCWISSNIYCRWSSNNSSFNDSECIINCKKRCY
jgi:hypothetical protein